MKDFFATPGTHWRQPNGSLHVYLLPDERHQAELAALQDRLVWDGSHARQPARWLHATVRRLPVFSTDLEPDRLIAELDAALAAVEPFEVTLSRLEVGDYGVVLSGDRSPAWNELVRTVEDAARAALPEVADEDWPGAPHTPHVSLSYGVADLPTPELDAVVAGLSVEQTWRVERCHLLAVDQHRDTGTYTWVDIASHPLGARGETA